MPPSPPQPGPTCTTARSRSSSSRSPRFPEDQRHGRPRDLFTIWFTSNLIPLAIVTGALATVTFGLAVLAGRLAIAARQPGRRPLHGAALGPGAAARRAADDPEPGAVRHLSARCWSWRVVVFMYLGFFASNLILGGQALNQLVSGVSVDWGIVISGARQPADRRLRLQHDPRPEPVAGHRVRRRHGPDRDPDRGPRAPGRLLHGLASSPGPRLSAPPSPPACCGRSPTRPTSPTTPGTCPPDKGVRAGVLVLLLGRRAGQRRADDDRRAGRPGVHQLQPGRRDRQAHRRISAGWS